MRHIFDTHETATRALVARQLHALADELAAGEVDLGSDEAATPTAVVDPLDVTVDLRRNRSQAEFTLRMRWSTTAAGAVA